MVPVFFSPSIFTLLPYLCMIGKTVRGDIVKNIMIFPSLPLHRNFNPDNPVHIKNRETPEMRIRGEIDGKIMWWDINGNYYHHREPKKGELLMPGSFIYDHRLKLIEIKEG